MLIETNDRVLKKELVGNSFVDTFRHGKFLFIKLKKGKSLMLHFGMTGDLLYYTPDKQAPVPYVLLFEFANENNLDFSDWRRFGRIALVDNVEKFIEKRGYGKDAMLIGKQEFLRLVGKRKTSIKAVLLNQKILAGVGNEFADEILFQSRVHPASTVMALSQQQLSKIYDVMQRVLRDAVKANADRDKLKKYFFLNNRKAGLSCVRCGNETEFETVGGRSSYFCPNCQPLSV